MEGRPVPGAAPGKTGSWATTAVAAPPRRKKEPAPLPEAIVEGLTKEQAPPTIDAFPALGPTQPGRPPGVSADVWAVVLARSADVERKVVKAGADPAAVRTLCLDFQRGELSADDLVGALDSALGGGQAARRVVADLAALLPTAALNRGLQVAYAARYLADSGDRRSGRVQALPLDPLRSQSRAPGEPGMHC